MQYLPCKQVITNPINQKSDLYIYFYWLGLSLLNNKGSFCFIASNSWLDVGYGANLQEFSLKYCHIKLILDNETMRSFASASINTVEEEEQTSKKGKKAHIVVATEPPYTGNKWSGKYLRAPDIYWTIIEKGKDKLVLIIN